MRKGAALIMANFHIRPEQLSPREYGDLFNKAIWLETWRLTNQAKMVSALFKKKK